MDYPPMFNVSKIDIWKVRMCAHLKILSLHVYLATTKESYLDNSKHKKANAQALKALRKSLSKEYLNIVSHCNSAFAVWNILTSPELQTQINEKEKSSGEESDQRCLMVQGNDSLEVYSDTQLDNSTSSSCNECVDAHALNNELAIGSEKFYKNINF